LPIAGRFLKMKVSELTIEELTNLIYEAVEVKLKETLGDPDWNLELREDIRERPLNSLEAVERGESGMALRDVVSKTGLD